MATVISNTGVRIQSWPGYLDLLKLHRNHPERYPALLASTSRSSTSQDRYDILFAFPQGGISLWPDGLGMDGFDARESTFLTALDRCWAEERKPGNHAQTELPFSGGWFLFLGYELAAEIEPSLHLVEDNTSAIPIARAMRIPAAIINDRQQQQSWLVYESDYADLYPQMVSDIEKLSSSKPVDKHSHIEMMEEKPEDFLRGVQRVKEYIREGDVFQVNLSRHWQGENKQSVTAGDVFSRLANSNPAPFAGLVRFDGGAIVSSSPERLVRTQQRKIETRPIAGTRPRGEDEKSDQSKLDELIGHPKERAEHVMLIDLERNDLGRVSQPGSVRVNELMVLESYAHVHHIVSNVEGELKPGTRPGEIIRAVFPGGTITGCPKVRCMEIIAELEQATRGPYTGAMGYLNHNGDMDLNILIRSIVMDGDKIAFRAGAGLVADSVGDYELQETRAKARGMLLSLQGQPA